MGLREKRTEETKAMIIDAASELFALDGFDATSLRRIADKVGIKDPAILHHFPTKDALWEAVLAKSISPIVDLSLSLSDEDVEITRRVERILDGLIDFCQTNPRAARLVWLGILLRPDETRKVFEKMLSGVVASVMEAMELGIKKGKFRDDFTDLVAFLQCASALIFSSHAALPTLSSFWQPDQSQEETYQRIRTEIKRILRDISMPRKKGE